MIDNEKFACTDINSEVGVLNCSRRKYFPIYLYIKTIKIPDIKLPTGVGNKLEMK